MKINFFNNDLKDALKTGVYIISITCENDHEKELYIGESVWPLVRCATHLYKVYKNPIYFGLTSNDLDNEKLAISFKMYKNSQKRDSQKCEKELIKELKPLTQSGVSDRMKKLINKVEDVQQYLFENKS